MEYLIIALLTILNGFFALSEIALVSTKKSKMEHLASKGNKRAKIVLTLLENPEDFLSSVQVGITLIGIVAGAYGGSAIASSLASTLTGIPLIAPYAESLSLIIAIGGITYFSIVIGELVPKTIAMNHPESLALMSVPILVPFMRLTSPFVRLLSFSTTLILGLLGVRDTWEEKISEEELIAHLKTARKQWVLDKDESSFHHNVFAFSDQSAQSIITHRSDIDWVDISDSKEVIFKKIQKSVHSRFVVADESLDTVVGILKVKDFLEHYHEKDFSLRKNLTKPLSVALTTPAIQILNTFKKKKEYIAIVKDEHGGTEGIITLHDLIEIIVWDLPDEDEESEGNIIVSRDGHLISGKTLIYEINQYFQETVIEEDTAEYTTLSGYIMHRLERLPRTGEVISTENHDFEVVDMDAMRIDKVLLTKKTESWEEP